MFDNPKDHNILARLVRYCTSASGGELILDFFAGAASTAEAVLQLNREQRGDRRFVMIQLPEPLPPTSEAHKQGYDTIADIARDRVRKAIVRLEAESEGQQKLKLHDSQEDLGFRAFKLAESNYRPWQGTEEPEPESYAKQMELHADPLVDGWKAEDVLWEVATKEGFGLGSHIERLEKVNECTAYRVTDADRGQSFVICLDDKVELGALNPLDLNSVDLFICRDSAVTDEAAANLALQCRLKTI